MKIDLAAARTTPETIEVSLPPEGVDIAADAEIVANVEFRGSVWRDPRGRHVSGHFETKVKLECVRCLAAIEKAIAGDFDDLFAEEEQTTPGELELTPELMDVSFAGDSVELAEVLREQILLEVPEQTFCREDCRGLCPKCGQDLNLIDCNCSADIDPRWAALKDLN
ncbi:MAG TPA: DUF177 domain-containing protein [Pyrinomonadaceae bacterium]|mgnify:CR=1 FL=1|nr:DUF177 domain-containing protein [Pyrinomonadaceae bacterium]